MLDSLLYVLKIIMRSEPGGWPLFGIGCGCWNWKFSDRNHRTP